MDWKKAWEFIKLAVPRPDLSYKASRQYLENFIERSPGIANKTFDLAINLRMTPGYLEKAKVLFGPQGQLLAEEQALAFSDFFGYIGSGVAVVTDVLTLTKLTQFAGRPVPAVSKIGHKLRKDIQLITPKRYPVLKTSRTSPSVITGVERTKRGIKYDKRILEFKKVSELPSTRLGADIASYLFPKGVMAYGQLKDYNKGIPGQISLGMDSGISKPSSVLNDNWQKVNKAAGGFLKFDWDSDTIPPIAIQKKFYKGKPGQVGWGLDIGDSKPRGVLTDIWNKGNQAAKGPMKFDWDGDAIPPIAIQKKFYKGKPGQVGWGLDLGGSKPIGALTDIWNKGNPAAKGPMKFDWDSDAIPPIAIQKNYYKGKPGQVGWGLDIGDSKPIGTLTDIWLRGNQAAKGPMKFDWDSDAIPPIAIQKKFYKGKPGQVGWGLDLGGSKPIGALTDIWLRRNK